MFAFFYVCGRQPKLVPTGVQNIAESAVDFIRNGIILQTMGPDGLPWTPFLLTLFTFIFMGNIWEIIPGVQMPVNARIAFPALMAIVVWVLYHFVGIKEQGLVGYFKSTLVPPGVPKAHVHPPDADRAGDEVHLAAAQPGGPTLRQHARRPPAAGELRRDHRRGVGHRPTIVIWPFSFGLLVGLTAFEVLVAFLQAFIFTMLAAVYIGSSMHPEH